MAAALIVAAVALNLALWNVVEKSSFMLLLAAVFLAGLYGGVQAGTFATGLAVLASIYFFTPPLYRLAVTDITDVIRLTLFAAIAVLMTWITSSGGRAQRQLAMTEEGFRLLVENVRDYAIFMLDRDGVIRTWNVGAARMKGYQPHEIIGQPYAVLYTEEDRAAGRPQQHLTYAGQDGAWKGEGWRRRKDGSRFWAEGTLTTIRDTTGAVRGFGKVTRDLTERREAEERLLSAYVSVEDRVQERTETLHKAKEALEWYSQTIAHDFRAHLRVIEGYGRVLLDEEQALSEQGRRYVGGSTRRPVR